MKRILIRLIKRFILPFVYWKIDRVNDILSFLKSGLQVTLNIYYDFSDKGNVLELIKKIRPQKTQFPLIRFGSKLDGGYLVPDDLRGIKVCFSPGVSDTFVFEETCYQDYGMEIYMADKSVDKPRSKIIPDRHCHFTKKFIGIHNDDDFITMEKWIKSSKISEKADLLLQMDIEGHEYLPITNIPESLLKRFRIIVIECHDLNLAFYNSFLAVLSNFFDKLLKHHVCVHSHPNNISSVKSYQGIKIPMVCEFTFLRKDRARIMGPAEDFPHRLDTDNDPEAKSVVLPEIWYRD